MTGVVVYGAGGHGKVVADIAVALGLPVTGFLDDGKAPGAVVLDSPATGPLTILGGSGWLAERPGQSVALGIGDNETRECLAERCVGRGHPLATLVHPSAVVSAFATIGAGSVVMANAVLNPAAVVGRGCIINTAAVIEHDVIVGDFAHVSPNATLAGGAGLGARSHLGSGAVVIPLVQIGARCTIGAGAVVIRAVPNGTKAVGVPARPLST
ncbi:MAG: acetyltransferase [Polyangiaceae bacterium]|nr:acetyltransferase [Polyangiaceae bacterium]